MAKASASDQLKVYRQRIDASRQWRKQEGFDAIWRRMLDLYRGRHYENYSDEDRLLVNIVFSTVNVIAPSVSVNYPKITVSAVKPENAPQAVIAETVVNYWWRYNDIRSQFRRAVKDMILFGHGWIKVGYRFVEEQAVGSEDDISDPLEGGEGSSATVITEDAPFAERVSVFDVFVDSDATSMHDAKWIAQRIRRPIREVKTDPRYSKSAREKVEVAAVARYSEDPSKRKVHDKSYGYAEIWEFYDIKAKTMCVFADGGEQFLIKPTRMPYSFGHPFVMLSNYDVPDSFYPIGDVEQIEPLQKELNETRSQMMNHRKRFARKYLYKESAFDQVGRGALESDDDNVMVPVISDEPLGNVVANFPALINPPEFYDQSNLIVGDIERISGLPEYMTGGVSEIRRTATEVSAVRDAANARTADKLSIVERAISEVGYRMVALCRQFMTGEKVARLTGKDGEPIWVTYDRDYLEGEFDFEVVGGSTQPNNDSLRKQTALQIMDAMAPLASAGVVNMQELASYVLQYGFNIKNPEKFLAQPQQQAPAGPQGMPPQGAPQGPVPAQGDMPPEIMAALQGQPPAQ
jgi:hypothetical protein